jgi:hypothetical protein
MSDDLRVNVPKLAADGSNWVIYRDRMTWAMDSRGLSDHLTNDSMPAAYSAAGTVNGITAPVRWANGEATVKQAIAASVTDSIFNRIKGSTRAKSVWDALKQLFEGRTQMIVVDLRRQIQTLKCGEEDNVRIHFDTIANLREQLAAMGKSIPDDEYASILLGSLPTAYDATTSAMSTTASLTNTNLTPDTVIRLITDEFDRRALKTGKSKDSQDEALTADAGRKKSKKDIECFNCKKRGHMRSDCWAKGGGKEGQGPRKKRQDGAAGADEQVQPDIEAWAAIEEISDPADQSSFACKPRAESELYDSGASCHMSPFRHQFISYRQIAPRPIMAADKRLFFATGMGDLRIQVPNGESFTPVTLRDTLFAPEMALTVVSISRITKAGFAVSFEGNACKITSPRGKVVGTIPSNGNGLYRVEHVHAASPVTNEAIDIRTLHRRLGHVAAETIRALVRSHAIQGISLIDDGQKVYCESCEYAKATRKVIKKEREGAIAEAFGDEIHTDVWGPSPLQTIGGRKYYITFTDDHSRYSHIKLLRSKDEAFQAYKDFSAWALTQHGVKIKRLRSDRGGEYTSAEFDRYLKEQGTERRLTTHDTPQHNGVAESLNRRLLERVRAVLHHSGLPKHLWGEAVYFVTWLKNRTSTRALGNVTPYERLHGLKPNLAGVPEWGQRVWIHTDAGSKLDGRAVEGHWVGYDKDSTHAHRIYWPGKNSISVERNIRFAPTTVTIYNAPGLANQQTNTSTTTAPPAPPSLPPALPPIPTTAQPQPHNVALPQSDAEEEEEDDDEDVEDQLGPALPGQYQSTPSGGKAKQAKQAKPRTSESAPGYTQPTRTSSRKSKPSDYMKRLEAGEGTTGEEYTPDPGPGPNIKRRKKTGATAGFADDFADYGADCAFVTGVIPLVAEAISDAHGDPSTISEAQSRPDWPLWQRAMDREMKTLEDAGTWETVPRPPGRNIVGSKWVFRIKRNADGSVEKYKARLVARGFTQVYGADYFETYSPVAKLTTFRTILALAAQKDWDIDSFDFNGAYLNGELNEQEDIYMKNPPGYDSDEETVKHLKKSLYGLKQAGRKWYDTLKRTLADLGFRVSEVDPGVFHTRAGGHPVIIAVHVDDCAITSSSAEALQDYKRKINARHSITDLGPIHWLLGIKITRDRDARTIALSQESFIDTIIKRFSLGDAKPIPFPISPSISYSAQDAPADKTEAARMAKVPYRQAIGSLMYASVATRPDISFAVSTLSQFLENPGEAHWEAAKRVFRYLSGTRAHALTYGGDRHELVGYTDADGSSQDHRRAISGLAFLIDGGAISWSSRKQELVALSTAEAEYVAATHAAKEGIWLRRLIGELFDTINTPTTLYCDNQAAITLAITDNFHARTKHIDIRYHFIRHAVDSEVFVLVYCPTDDMTADILTKPLPAWKVKGHVAALGLRSACGGVLKDGAVPPGPFRAGAPMTRPASGRSEDSG